MLFSELLNGHEKVHPHYDEVIKNCIVYTVYIYIRYFSGRVLNFVILRVQFQS